jgi:hypothetical protein
MLNIRKGVILLLIISIILEAQEIVCKKKKLWRIKTKLKMSYNIINQKVAQLGIGCVDEKGNILWYVVLKGKTTRDTIVVGVNNKVINVHDINLLKVNDIFCKKDKDNQWRYLLELPLRLGGNFYDILSPHYDKVSEIKKVEKGKRFGFIAHTPNNKMVAVIDGNESKGYDGVYNLTFSSNGLHYGFVGQKGSKYVMVIDGNESEEYNWIKDITFSPDGLHYGFVAQKGNKWVVVIDGKESKEYDDIAVRTITFSPDGSRYGFKAIKENKAVVVIDGNEIKQYDEVFPPIFSADGSRYGFIARRFIEGKGSRWIAVINGNESNEYYHVGELTFSPKGSRYGFVAIKGNKSVVVIDGTEYDGAGLLTFSPDGSKYGFVAIKGNKSVAVINGKESKEYDSVGELTFSPEGSRYGFVAKKGNKYVAVIDGNESKEYDWVCCITFSSDGSKYGFMAIKGYKYVAVIDGKESKGYSKVEGLTFSSDGSSYWFPAIDGINYVIVVNGKEYKIIRNIMRQRDDYSPLIFKDKDFEIVFTSYDEKGEYGVVNFHKTAHFEKISEPFLVKAQGPNQKSRVEFLGSKHKKIYRISCTKK